MKHDNLEQSLTTDAKHIDGDVLNKQRQQLLNKVFSENMSDNTKSTVNIRTIAELKDTSRTKTSTSQPFRYWAIAASVVVVSLFIGYNADDLTPSNTSFKPVASTENNHQPLAVEPGLSNEPSNKLSNEPSNNPIHEPSNNSANTMPKTLSRQYLVASNQLTTEVKAIQLDLDKIKQQLMKI